MPRPELARPSWWDSNMARDILRDRAVSAEGVLGGHRIRLACEPLLRHDGSGGLLQSVRVTTGGRPVTRARVTTLAGSALRCDVLPGPGDETRLLVPEVEAPTPILVELPELADGDSVEVLLTPQRHWTLHLVQHAHLDIGYTDPQSTVLAEGRKYLDSLLELCRTTDDWPDESKFRWAVEGFFSYENWSQNRPPRMVEEFLDRVREGRIELAAMPFNLHTETCSTDELHELLRPIRELRRRAGIDITTAMQTDVPGQVVGLPDVLTDSGIRYLSVAHNWAGRAVPHHVGGQDLPRLFRWRAPSGRELLVWRTDTPHGLAYMEGSILGFDESFDRVDDLLPHYLSALANHQYPHEGRGIPGFPVLDEEFKGDPYPWDILHLRVLGKFADNGPPRRIIADTVRRWNEEWAFPVLRTSRNEDFFIDAEERLGDRLETFEGDWTDWWVDGVGAGAVPLAATRDGQAALADAQTVAGYAEILGASDGISDTASGGVPDGVSDGARITGAAPQVYRAASLFNEHTWGAGDPWTHGDHGHASGERQWHWKYAQALNAHDGARTLLDAASAALGERLSSRAGTLVGYYVVNTCSWERSETVRLFLPESTVPLDEAVRVVDARDGTPLEMVEEEQSNELHRAAGRFLLFRLPGVPAHGAVRVDIEPAPVPAAEPQAKDGAPAGAPTVLENEFLRVHVDLSSACIDSIVDKRTGAELVRQDATVGFNGYLYDEYATAGGFNHQSSKTTADASMHLLATRRTAPPAALVERTSDATGETLVYECAPAGTRRLRVTVHLPRASARIDLENRIDKTATLTKESAFFAFPFAMHSPALRMEATGGVTGTGLPTVPGSARHMRAIRRWVSLQENGTGAALATQDAPLIQMGGVAIPYAPYPQSLAQEEPGTVFSWVHNNIWDTNFPSQQAFDHVFRYSVGWEEGTAPGGAALGVAVLGMRTAAVASRPLLAVRAGRTPEASPETTYSLLTLDDARVRVVGLTVPEPGRLLVRLQSFAEEPVTCRLTPGFAVTAAASADYLGTEGTRLRAEPDGSLPVPVPRLGTTAVSLTMAESPDPR
ncbi:alpha-mannosidase [Streptomyces longisporoflavus]|uniref:glycoside hydrolase family 38 N-terminal domain-containing protein n=1 Tax=Streptomyces longisporoflavus TaxID=28044 RepID=UPI00167F1001|nr:glycoside hydrolase family 38 C-terminal domain-containing protein [Streptomyces longisporoflavus]GGV63847.1 alpha-mannosidase [Streptomyces longisporoflavus]